ncbi:MAG: hypothetical protein Q8P18_04655 [Pseudomonadota bacterium]|nr:hypothetical protein [Pseudomonadota bacterium]
MFALVLLGCAAPLLPNEKVLGVEQVAAFTFGGPGDHLGASVAARGERWLASAPGSGRTWRDGEAGDAPSVWVGWLGESEVLVSGGGRVTVDGVARYTLADATAWAASADALIAATPAGLVFVDQERVVPVEGLESVALGVDRVLGLVCGSDGCAGYAWSFEGVSLGPYATGGEGGAVGEWAGQAWAGAPAWDDPEGAGEVCAEDGACLAGLPGDHLGAAIGGGYAAGTFNKWVVPPRARFVPLDGGTVYSLEAGAELQPLVLAGDDVLVIGAPYMAAHGEPSGAVIQVPR